MPSRAPSGASPWAALLVERYIYIYIYIYIHTYIIHIYIYIHIHTYLSNTASFALIVCFPSCQGLPCFVTLFTTFEENLH